jgi:hypothetical protein
VIERRLVTAAFIQMLETATSVPVGLVEAPVVQPKKPWAVVHPIEGGGFSGSPFYEPDSDAAFVYQVDSVGRSAEQAQWMDDLVRSTVLARSSGAFQVSFPAIDAATVIDRRPDTSAGGVIPEGEKPNRLFTISSRYSIYVTPS